MSADTAMAYLDAALAALAERRESLARALDDAARTVTAAVRAGGRLYVFGTGHSHVLAEEVHYRAGGLAAVVPVLSGATMLHEGAVSGTRLERLPGLVSPILDRYRIGHEDVLLVASNSGVNAAPVEAARYGRERGARVIALTSVPYATAIAEGRDTLADLADVVLDNATPPGDAAIELPDGTTRAGPLSTLVGVALVNALCAEVAARLGGGSEPAPVYISANMPGASDHNARLVERYRPGNPHL